MHALWIQSASHLWAHSNSKFSHNRVRCAGAGGDSGRHQLCDFHHCQLSATRRQFQRQQPQNRSVLPHFPTKQRNVPCMHVTLSIHIQHALMNAHSGLQACLCLEDSEGNAQSHSSWMFSLFLQACTDLSCMCLGAIWRAPQ